MDRELILPTDFDDYAWEVESKGYFWDASVRIGVRVVPVAFYEPTRLAQDIADELAAGRAFTASRLIVLERVTLEGMRDAVARAPSELFHEEPRPPAAR
jgi:hypothetical protein